MSYRSNTADDPRDPCFKEIEDVSKFNILNAYMDNFTGKASEQMLNETLQNSGVTPRDMARIIIHIAKEDKKSINYVLIEMGQGNERFLISSITRMAVLDIIIQDINQFGQKPDEPKIFNSTDLISKYLFSDLIKHMK
jgi:hypothetical protein